MDMCLDYLHAFMCTCMHTVVPSCRPDAIGCGNRPPTGPVNYCACDSICRSNGDCCPDYNALCRKFDDAARLVSLAFTGKIFCSTLTPSFPIVCKYTFAA